VKAGTALVFLDNFFIEEASTVLTPSKMYIKESEGSPDSIFKKNLKESRGGTAVLTKTFYKPGLYFPLCLIP